MLDVPITKKLILYKLSLSHYFILFFFFFQTRTLIEINLILTMMNIDLLAIVVLL